MDCLIFSALILAPAYALRFTLFGLPANLLMLWVAAIWLIFGCVIFQKKELADFWFHIKKLNTGWLWLIGLFFLAGTLSVFLPNFSEKKLGQYIILFIQPISLLFIFSYRFKKNPNPEDRFSMPPTFCSG